MVIWTTSTLNLILYDNVHTRYRFETSGQYYIYNQVSDTLYWFAQSTELSSIIPALENDWKNIKLTEIELLWANSEFIRLPV